MLFWYISIILLGSILIYEIYLSILKYIVKATIRKKEKLIKEYEIALRSIRIRILLKVYRLLKMHGITQNRVNFKYLCRAFLITSTEEEIAKITYYFGKLEDIYRWLEV